MKGYLAAGALALATVGATGAAFAQPVQAGTVSAASPEGLASAIRAAGYAVTVERDDDGDPRLAITKDAVRSSLVFHGCTAGTKCTSVMFYWGRRSNGEVSVGRVNNWNRTKRWGRGYIDGDADPCLEMDVDMSTGMTAAQFNTILGHWWTALASFREATA